MAPPTARPGSGLLRCRTCRQLECAADCTHMEIVEKALAKMMEAEAARAAARPKQLEFTADCRHMQIVEQFLAEFEAKAAAAAPLAAKHLEPVGGPNCGCRSGCQPAGRFMTRNLGPDHGRWFFTCIDGECGYWKWADKLPGFPNLTLREEKMRAPKCLTQVVDVKLDADGRLALHFRYNLRFTQIVRSHRARYNPADHSRSIRPSQYTEVKRALEGAGFMVSPNDAARAAIAAAG